MKISKQIKIVCFFFLMAFLKVEIIYAVGIEQIEVFRDQPAPFKKVKQERETQFIDSTRVEDNLLYSTVRIEDGKSRGTGTGFLMKVAREGKSYTFLVTNAHNIFSNNEDNGSSNNSDSDSNNSPIYVYFHLKDENGRSKICKVYFPPEFRKNFIKTGWNAKNSLDSRKRKRNTGSTEKPQNKGEEDMCAVWLDILLENIKQKNLGELYFASLDVSSYFHSSSSPFSYQNFSEEIPQTTPSVTNPVIMVGYPEDIWDKRNYYPIIRQGTIATDPVVDFNSKEEFLIDIPLYPGSSGSPVFMIKRNKTERAYAESSSSSFYGAPVLGKESTQIFFLGMTYGGPPNSTLNYYGKQIEGLKKELDNYKKEFEEKFDTLKNVVDANAEDIRDHEEQINELKKTSPNDDISNEEISDEESAAFPQTRNFLNLAYVIKPQVITGFLSNYTNRDKGSVVFSGVKYCVADKISDLLGKSVEELENGHYVKCGQI